MSAYARFHTTSLVLREAASRLPRAGYILAIESAQ